MARLVTWVQSEDVEFRDAPTVALDYIDGQVREDEIASVLADSLRLAYRAVSVHRQQAPSPASRIPK
jgi:hypothetical protein